MSVSSTQPRYIIEELQTIYDDNLGSSENTTYYQVTARAVGWYRRQRHLSAIHLQTLTLRSDVAKDRQCCHVGLMSFAGGLNAAMGVFCQVMGTQAMAPPDLAERLLRGR